MSAPRHDLQAVDALQEELKRLRGVGSMGMPPPLDHEGPNDDDGREDIIEEALTQMQSQMLAAEVHAAQADRAALQEHLVNRTDAARDEHKALQSYLEQLRSRQDETGDAMRSANFETEVDTLANRGRAERETGTGAASGGRDVSVDRIMKHVNDPATFEALLEVQRLDEALKSSEQQQQTPRGLRGLAPTEQAGAARSRPESARRMPRAAPSVGLVAPRNAAPDAGPTFLTEGDAPSLPSPTGGGVGTRSATEDAVSALTEEIGKLRGLEGGHTSLGVSQGSCADQQDDMASADYFTVGSLTVGSRRRGLGGIWISVADEARIEALLADEQGGVDGEDEHVWSCAAGEGYQPPKEQAERLASIDAALDEFCTSRAFTESAGIEGELSPEAPSALAASNAASSALASASAPPGAAVVLGEMRQQRAQAQELDRIRVRLSALHSKPTAEAAESADELDALFALLGSVRAEAERQIDARPSSSRPRSSGLPLPLPPPPPQLAAATVELGDRQKGEE